MATFNIPAGTTQTTPRLTDPTNTINGNSSAAYGLGGGTLSVTGNSDAVAVTVNGGILNLGGNANGATFTLNNSTLNASAGLNMNSATVAYGTGANGFIASPDVASSSTFEGITFTGFQTGDTITTGLTGPITNLHYSGGTLSFTQGGTNYSLSVALAPGQTANFNVASVGGVPVIVDGALVCFVSGTRVRTTRGDIPVEDLKAGAEVVTASGRVRPVRWVGHNVLRAEAGHSLEAHFPIRIAEGAFGEGLPSRDLWISPGHCVAVNGALIPINVLENGRTITQERKTVDYWHVELDEHDVILAEGLPCESYLDTGNRITLASGEGFSELSEQPKHWSDTCLPYTASGPAVEKTKADLLAQALALGHRITSEPDLHIVADGRRVEPIRLREKRYLFVLPPDRGSVTLHSRTFRPADTNPTSGDRRSLGVCILRMQIDGDDLPLDSELGKGWHYVETDGAGLTWRWADGATPLPSNVRAILLDLGGPGAYWLEEEARPLAIVA